MKLGVICATIAGLLLNQQVLAADIRVLAAGATKEIVVDLIPSFEQASGNKITTTWTGSAGIKQRMSAGEAYDVVIVGAPVIDAFIKQGSMVAGSRVDLMKSAMGVAVRAGKPKPDIGSLDGLKASLLGVSTIGYSTGPSGDHLIQLLERMGITDQIKPKLRQVPTGGRIGTTIAHGEVEIGFQQASELIHEPGVDYVGPLPAGLQLITVYSAGIHSGANEAEAGRAFIKHLTGPAAPPIIRAHGMEPG